MLRLSLGLLSLILSTAVASTPVAAADDVFEIRVVDDRTGRGVPLVELETTNAVKYVTDSNGLVALDDRGLFGQKVYFAVRSHGYEFPADGFGYRGARIDVTSGGSATLKMKRLNIAERLYRMTGADIYRDSMRLGRPVPIDQPLLNAQVYGCDSVVNAIYRGKIHWFWGDTNRPSYPLGLFHVPGAVSELPSEGGLDPKLGVNLRYFTGEDGFARATAQMPGEGPTWIDALTTLTDDAGRERLYAAYVKIKPPLTTYARGLAVWNDETERFEKLADLPVDAAVLPGGHPFKHTTDGVEHVYFATSYPLVRVRATPLHFTDLDQYEAFTCLVEGSGLDDARLDRTEGGMLRYSWKRNTPPLRADDQKKLIDAGKMKPGEGLLAFRDRDTGKAIVGQSGSVYWNEHRGRWVMIFGELFGTSMLGEIRYAEADSPVGPWVYAVKILTHDRYDFYNPKQHPMFDQDGGRTIFFEGTYTNTFSGNPVRTPRYDYNQVMYKLDLDDPRLALPVPIYRVKTDGVESLVVGTAAGPHRPDDIAFFALDRPGTDSIPIYEVMVDGRPRLSLESAGSDGKAHPLFHALPAAMKEPPAATRLLYEFVDQETGRTVYSTDADPPSPQFARQERPVCLVWENPLRLTWEGDVR